MVGQPLFGQQNQSSKQRLAQALMQQGADTAPVGSWTQGAARLADGYIGGRMQHQINQQNQIGGAGSVPATAGPGPGGGPPNGGLLNWHPGHPFPWQQGQAQDPTTPSPAGPPGGGAGYPSQPPPQGVWTPGNGNGWQPNRVITAPNGPASGGAPQPQPAPGMPGQGGDGHGWMDWVNKLGFGGQ